RIHVAQPFAAAAILLLVLEEADHERLLRLGIVQDEQLLRLEPFRRIAVLHLLPHLVHAVAADPLEGDYACNRHQSLLVGCGNPTPPEDRAARSRPLDMDAHVWIGTGNRFNPLQQFQEGTLILDGETLTVQLPGGTFSVDAHDAELTFPRLMTGTGFEMTVGDVKAHVWFYDPYAGRSALLSGSD